MEFKLHCLLWVTLASTSAYNYQGISYPFFDYPQSDDTDRNIQTRRIDTSDIRPPLPLIRNPEDERIYKINRPQRTNERSIAVDSGVQRVQEKEKKRVPIRIDETHRSENVSFKIVNNYPLIPSISSRQGDIQDRAGVVFPGPTSASLEPEIPEECKQLGICENVPNYPQDLVDELLANLGEKKKLLYNVDTLDEPEIVQRIGPEDSEGIDMELCSSRENIMSPQAAQDVTGEWYFILNQKDKPLQGYRVEICSNRGNEPSRCINNIASLYSGYTAYCKQKYVKRTMAAVDKKNKQIVPDIPFRVPSCCSCVAKKMAPNRG